MVKPIKWLYFLALFYCALTLTGCSLFSPVNTPQTTSYTINTINPTIPTCRHTYKTLLVMTPQTSRPYETTEMAYVVKPHQLAYFSNSNWADTPPQMLLPLMVQALQNTGHFKAVVSTPFIGNYDVILSTQLLQLQQEFIQRPSHVRLAMRAQLINNNSRKIIATREFVEIEPAPHDNPDGGVIATNRAAARLLQQLTAFCVAAT